MLFLQSVSSQCAEVKSGVTEKKKVEKHERLQEGSLYKSSSSSPPPPPPPAAVLRVVPQFAAAGSALGVGLHEELHLHHRETLRPHQPEVWAPGFFQRGQFVSLLLTLQSTHTTDRASWSWVCREQHDTSRLMRDSQDSSMFHCS